MSLPSIFTEAKARARRGVDGWGPALLFGLALLMPLPAAAQSLWERLVLPGDLTAAHAEFQTDCSNCHENFEKGAQPDLCLDCHKPVAADLRAREGFHGRSSEAQAAQCNHCHTDHNGRDAPIIILDAETFDHGATDFTLTGRHKSLNCGDCHADGKPFREAATTCIGCHKPDDPHKGELGEACADCHVTQDWTEVSAFDHAKTDFPLSDTHAKLPCTSCHAGDLFEGLPLTCNGCHRIQDVHGDRFGQKCDDCHKATKWTEVSFDHDKDTDFALDGAHVDADCNGCHLENVKLHPPETDCVACHLVDDAHRGALGPGCKSCHVTTGWADNVAFDHEFTEFPLIGLHGIVPCEACHIDTSFQVADQRCVACHLGDDSHKGTLGPNCQTCHNPTGWDFWLFDHDAQTRFALTGAHRDLGCKSCHRSAVSDRPEQSRSCVACHAGDDKHNGTFGRDCAQCHSTVRFKGARLK